MSWPFILFFGGWLSLTLAVHASSGCARCVRQWDRWSLLPVWRFFVANSMRNEFFIVSRTLLSSVPMDRRVLPPPHSRAPWRVLFNPGRLDSKAFADVAYFVVQGKDDQIRRVLVRILDSATVGSGAWTILNQDNLRGGLTVADTLP